MSEAKMTINIRLLGTTIYLGIGLLYHLIMDNDPFSWTDPWLFVTMAIWPLFVLMWMGALFVAIICIVFVGWFFTEEYPNIRRRRAQKKAEKTAREIERQKIYLK